MQPRLGNGRAGRGTGGLLGFRSFAAVGTVLLLAFTMSACSSSDSGSSASTTTAAPTTTGPEGAEPTCPAADGSSPRTTRFSGPPPQCIDAGKAYSAVVETDRGSFTIALDPELAPVAVNNFVFLAGYHYYDGLDFYRVIPETMVATGKLPPPEPEDPGYLFADELPPDRSAYVPGAVLMDNGGPDSNGSAFFVLLTDQTIAPKFTVFGTVTEGLDTTVAAIAATGTPGGTPTAPTIVQTIAITES